MDYIIVEQGLSKEQNLYVSSHAAPLVYQTIFDFSVEALLQGKMNGIKYLMLSSFYGSYYYALVQPHSMFMMACSGFSFFFLIGWINYQMSLNLCIADA